MLILMLSVDYSSGQLMCVCLCVSVCLSLTLSVLTLRLMKVLLSCTLRNNIIIVGFIVVLNSWIMGGKSVLKVIANKCHRYANEYSLTMTMFCNI